MGPLLPPLPDVSPGFFTYASGLSESDLISLHVFRMQQVLNKKAQLRDVREDLRELRAEEALCSWLLREFSSSPDEDVRFARAVGIKLDG